MFRFKIGVVIFLSISIIYNLYQLFIPNQLNTIRWQMASLSAGERYVGRLNLWYYFAQNQLWDQAKKLESELNSQDIAYFYSLHHPLSLKKKVNQLVIKDNKTTDDYVELARIQFLLGMNTAGLKSLESAKNLDPIRQDIAQSYFEASSFSSP